MKIIKNVDYVVGVFLAETDIVTHEIPVKTISREKKVIGKKTKEKNTQDNLVRKTEHSTKKRNKKQITDND